MKTEKKMRPYPQYNNYKEKSLKIFMLICLNMFIFLLFYICAIQIIYAGTPQPDAKDSAQMMELQAKLDELNASVAAVNNESETSKEIKGKDNIKSEAEANKADTSKDTKKEKAEAERNEREKKSENKQDKITGEEYDKEKKKTAWIIKTIDNGTHKDRKNAINQILTIKDQGQKRELGEKIIDIIKNETELEVKIKAITVAGEIKLKDSTPYLINSLNNEPEDVSVAAVYAIKRIGDHSAKPALIAKLKEQKLENNSTLIEALIDTLGEFKAAELSAFASDVIKDTKTNQIIRELIVLFLGKIESKESKDTLITLLKDEDENEQIRAFAANSLANLKITEAAADIEKIAQTIESYPFNKKKKFYNLYIYCIAALVKLGDEKAFPRFINALRSDNAVVRLKAVRLIKEVKDKRTIDILKYKMNYDPSSKVQSAAKEALKELGVDVESVKKDNSNLELSKKFDSQKEEKTKNETQDE